MTDIEKEEKDLYKKDFKRFNKFIEWRHGKDSLYSSVEGWWKSTILWKSILFGEERKDIERNPVAINYLLPFLKWSDDHEDIYRDIEGVSLVYPFNDKDHQEVSEDSIENNIKKLLDTVPFRPLITWKEDSRNSKLDTYSIICSCCGTRYSKVFSFCPFCGREKIASVLRKEKYYKKLVIPKNELESESNKTNCALITVPLVYNEVKTATLPYNYRDYSNSNFYSSFEEEFKNSC